MTTMSGGEGGGGGDSGGGVASGVSSLISSITSAADTTSDNMSQAVMWINEQKKYRDQVRREERRFQKTSAEDRRRYDQEFEHRQSIEGRGMRSNIKSAAMAREQQAYEMQQRKRSDADRASFSTAFMRGMAMGVGATPLPDGSMNPTVALTPRNQTPPQNTQVSPVAAGRGMGG